MGSRRTRTGERDGLVAAGGAIVAIAVALLLAPLRDTIGVTNVALLLTLVVVGAAAAGGRIAGATTAVVAALGFNAVHLRPYGTLRIDRPQDVLTCVLMVVVGVAVGELAHLAVDRGHRSSSDRAGIAMVAELRDMVAAGRPTDELLERATEDLVELLGLRSCTFVAGATAADPHVTHVDLDRHGAPPAVQHTTLRHGLGGFELPAEGAGLLVTGRDGSVLGRFVLEPTAGHGVNRQDRELAAIVAEVIAPTLEAASGDPIHPHPDSRNP
ncbi:MAG: DUF4118 domain-containing protein [Actinobacteria bacterium]|nr:DUF4118 domain-containing protein [Actinomycetota bacterium]